MKYTSINIHGNLISEEILQKIEEIDASGQLVKDFGFETGINLRSEIEYAWSRIKLDWKHFFDRTEKLPSSDPYGTTISRKWMTSFFNTLGFELTLQKASLKGDNEQLYSISHTCDQIDGLPIHIAGFHDPSHPEKNTLDIRSSGGTSRLSPHSTIQEFLNVTEHLYSMVTNGFLLRLVRDSGRLVKMTYIEFDLKRLLDEDKYSEFTLLYRLLHASRFPRSKQETDQCLLEKYYQNSIESGNRIRDGLSGAVKESLIALGNGLFQHPDNEELRESILSGILNAGEFYHQLLRLIYRLLFLMVTEERDLIFPETIADEENPDIDDLIKGIRRPTRKQKEIYYNYYSLVRLRKLSEIKYLQENQYTDLWQGLIRTFALFETEGTGIKLGIQALGSELFSRNAMPDITHSKVNNKVLLSCIKSLNEFEDEKHNLSFINYRALDVEELGSVYEGLLELEPVFEWENSKPKFTFKAGSERSSSGSHYTPEDLVKPLIQHSLEYLIEERVTDFYKGKTNKVETKKKLLNLKICDVACGSGHILLSAARRIALEVARVETGEQQPNPTSFRHALKEVIKNSIYGVDKNPLAVELCKVALWLESHNPGEPLSFLDHRIKCGDAIVGLAHREELEKGIATEAFKAMPDDNKEITRSFSKRNNIERKERDDKLRSDQLKASFDNTITTGVQEAMITYQTFLKMPETTPKEIIIKTKAYKKFLDGKGYTFLKTVADSQIAQFFMLKTEANKDRLITDAEYRQILRGYMGWQNQKTSYANVISNEKRFFHWFLEFPEVFQKGGFDCILGNPPFLGDRRLKEAFGEKYLEWMRYKFSKGATVDLVVYFFLRINSIIKNNGFQSLISTNTVAQGKSRETGLERIIENGSTINHAVKGMKWPGLAAVEVSLVSIIKGRWEKNCILNGKATNNISAFLDDSENTGTPFQLYHNFGKSFQGSIILGMGYVLNPKDYESLIRKDQRNKDVIFPYINGDDLNNNPDQKPSRYVINFFDWTENKASQYELPYSILLEKVKPERQRWKKDKNGNPIEGIYALRKPLPQKWWQHAERRPALYTKIKSLRKVLVSCRVSKYVNQSFIEVGPIFDVATTVVVRSNYWEYALLQSSLHEAWAWKYASTLESRIRYVNADCIDTYPIPENLSSDIIHSLDYLGETYHEHRRLLMLSMKLGLTKTYNAFHGKKISEELVSTDLSMFGKKSIEKKLGKEVWNLWNHLQKTENTCSFNEAIAGIIKLRKLHMEIDYAVLEAYGWQDIDLKHDFYEVDYLPENDRIRLTIHPNARKEILRRLLELNHKIHEEEVKTGLWDKKRTNKKKSNKSKSNGNHINEPEEGYGTLFDSLS